MKQFKILALVLLLAVFSSCGKDDRRNNYDVNSQNGIQEDFIGVWVNQWGTIHFNPDGNGSLTRCAATFTFSPRDFQGMTPITITRTQTRQGCLNRGTYRCWIAVDGNRMDMNCGLGKEYFTARAYNTAETQVD